MCINENNRINGKEMERKRGSMDAIIYVRSTKNKYNKKYHDKKWTLQLLAALYNSHLQTLLDYFYQ
jgi:hypothetical protein